MNRKIKVNVFIADDLHKSGITMLKDFGFVIYVKKGLDNLALLRYLKLKAANESILIFRSVRIIDKWFIDELLRTTNIKILCTASTGTDNVDVEYAKMKKIKVLNVPDGNYVSAAEHTFAMLLAIVKNITEANDDMKKDIYDYKRYLNYELRGKTIGIIGVGRVGSTVAKYARAFNMNILGNDIKPGLKNKYPWIKFVSKEELLKSSNIVSVHTPLDSSTRNLLDKNRLSLLKKSTVLLNCARGGIVDESVLIKMLKQKKIFFAGLDVFVNEPYINKSFLELPNIILTPHLAGKTKESRERISLNLAKQIIEIYKFK
ncbi:MAG: hypothetical protein EHM58_01885 [Ignavibacteriae bacterium]|nr:MAG: hypothetical protein EHM58_01885 [Ignavibacteriota bacterium]